MAAVIFYIAVSLVAMTWLPTTKGKVMTRNIFSTMFSTSVMMMTYYFGGFWDRFGWPQIVMLIILTYGLLDSLIRNNTTYVSKGLTYSATASTIIHVIILAAGGFFDSILVYFV